MKLNSNKNILNILIVLMLSILNISTAKAQVFGNEWINYSQSYFKFKIGEDGIYKIPQSVLSAYGMGNVAGSQFAIFRDGQQVPIYVSSNSAFGSNDYIEFYAEKSNGLLDQELYYPVDRQPNEARSILTDTAYYFLTFGGLNNLRLNLNPNITQSVSVEPYCKVTVQAPGNFRSYFSPGQSYYTGPEFASLHTGKYEKGEGTGIQSVFLYTISINTPQIYLTNSNPKCDITFFSETKQNSQFFQFSINNNLIWDSLINNFELIKKTISFNTNFLQNTNTIGLSNYTSNSIYNIHKCQITYNRTFDFSGITNLYFNLPSNGLNQKILIQNNSSSSKSVIDLSTNNLYHLNNVNEINLIPTTNDRKLYFTTNVSNINSLQPITFKNYNNATNQGDYIILTDEAFSSIPNGGIEQYKNYRNSALGGGFQVSVVNANDLYNQFFYGYNYHPLAIKNFLRYVQSNPNWVAKPEHLFIIGKGINYFRINDYLANPHIYTFPVVPTFGYPGSDNLFSEINNTNTPSIATGRFSALNNNEILGYLEKVKKYENEIRTPLIPNLENSLWKKKALHIAGATSGSLQTYIYNSLNLCKNVIEDTLVGGIVTTTGKTSTNPTESASAQIDSLVTDGIQYINFFGHASSAVFDYNLNSPEGLNSSPRFPIFMAYGCDVARIFEPTTGKTIGERYLLAENGGSIAMLAMTTYGWTAQLSAYMQGLYKQIGVTNYAKTFGKQIQANINYFQNTFGFSDVYAQVHSHCLLLQGDPGLAVYSPDKADYYIDEGLLSTNPAIINTTLDSFTLTANVYNLGKAVSDEIWVYLRKTKVGSSAILYSDSIKINVLNSKIVNFKIPVNATQDVGLFNFSIKLNESQTIDEISFENNTASLQIYIAEDNLKPIYPYDFSIVHQQAINLKASTLNPFISQKNYLLEIDTTEYFNSPFKKTKNVTSSGGVINWTIPFQMVDSTVYYWRTTIDSTVNGNYLWNTSSFVYLQNGSDGWNQSHYFQYKKDYSDFININEPDRKYSGINYTKSLKMQSGIFNVNNENIAYLNDDKIVWGSCLGQQQGLIFAALEPLSGVPMINTGQFPGGVGACDPTRKWQFEFKTATFNDRQNIMNFLNSIPSNYYVIVKSTSWFGLPNLVFAEDWKADELILGTGNSLYHKLLGFGFTSIDQYNANIPFAGVFQMNNTNFSPTFNIGTSINSLVDLNAELPFQMPYGTVTSTTIGPAANWQKLLWKIKDSFNTVTEKTNVKVFGLQNESDANGVELFSTTNRDTLLNTISATQYPYLKMEWFTEDSVNLTLPQLKYWRILYDPLPEAALNPNKLIVFKDSLKQGEQLNLKLAIENLRELPMDSMLVRYRLIDANNVSRLLGEKRYKPLTAHDTLIANFSYDVAQFPGKNYLFIEANPDNDQPEHYHPNNLGHLAFFVDQDLFAPVMDVTFDGVHILNNDIVSAKPLINVLVKDENKFKLITDSSKVTMSLLNNQTGVETVIPFDGSICKFYPATNNKNEARVEFRPTLDDGKYTLKVGSRDNFGNISGNVSNKYEIAFEVINKSTITNVLNYPNPFTTSTQFVFTLTGSEIPSQFKIQIISVTGKVVREITKAELGNIHIGRNITEYRWDGKDQFGQLLGNGVYLYRVITNNKNGEAFEKKTNSNIDKFFKNDYGKLYIMR